jgi:DNA polymerase III alpha subunit
MRQLQTELKDRTLRFDGVSIVNPSQVASALSRGVRPSELRVTEIDADIETMNQYVVEADRLLLAGDDPINLAMTWQLPAAYQELDLGERIYDDFFKRLPNLGYDSDTTDKAIFRLVEEINEIQKRGMQEFMRTIIFVLDTFREQKIVWGVGRGSSCACYILFVLGLHVVDCVKFDVPMNEFFHD